jgi:RNA polymerase sigma factor (sigma-70 family)
MAKPIDADSQAGFPSTSWTLIHAVQHVSGSQRRKLLGQLALRYWKPLYAYFRSKGQSPHDAADAVQEFLLTWIAGDTLERFQREGKRFRVWLMACAKNFLVDQLRKKNAARRRPGRGWISLDELAAAAMSPFEPAAGERPERAFQEAWRRSVLDRALRTAYEACVRYKREQDYAIFLAYYAPDGPSRPTWEQLAAEYQLENWKVASRRADWVKGQLARSIQNEIRQYVHSEAEVDDEIRDLIAGA